MTLQSWNLVFGLQSAVFFEDYSLLGCDIMLSPWVQFPSPGIPLDVKPRARTSQIYIIDLLGH